MNLNHKQLLDLPVYTESNAYLGRVTSFELNPETHQIVVYYVGSSSWVRTLLGEKIPELKIAAAQVVSLTEEKMVVEDLVIREKAKTEKVFLKQPTQAPAPAMSSRES